MTTYTVRLPGVRTATGHPPGRLLGDLLHALAHGSAGALRLRVEGRSAVRWSRVPAWIEQGAQFDVVGFTDDAPGVVLAAPTIAEALPGRFDQGELFLQMTPGQTALSLLVESLADASAGRIDSDLFDVDLLNTFRRDFGRIFRDGAEGVTMSNGNVDAAPVALTPQGLRTVDALYQRTPEPRRVRVAGRVDEARYSTGSFTLVLMSGRRVRGLLADGASDRLKPLFGEIAVVEGVAQFRPSGRLLRVDVDLVAPAGPSDVRVFAREPAPLAPPLDLAAIRRRPTPSGGIAAIIGEWPGDETDEEIAQTLRELS